MRVGKGRLFEIVSYHKNNGTKKTKKKFKIKEGTLNRYLRKSRQYYPDIFKKEGRKAKILLFDIENTPNEGYFWDIYNQNIPHSFITKPWYVLSWSAKWLGQDEVFFDSLAKYPKEFKKDHMNDKPICESIWELLNEADIVIGHNSVKHDIPKLRARFIKHDLEPYAPFKHIDTYLASRGTAYSSKSLDFMAKFFGVGSKIENRGISLWKDCMNPVLNEQAWHEMEEYNIVDTEILERVYLKIRPWINNHPNVNLYSDPTEVRCVKCGGVVEEDGDAFTPANVYQAYRCTECGAWSRSRYQKITTEKKKQILTNYL